MSPDEAFEGQNEELHGLFVETSERMIAGIELVAKLYTEAAKARDYGRAYYLAELLHEIACTTQEGTVNVVKTLDPGPHDKDAYDAMVKEVDLEVEKVAPLDVGLVVRLQEWTKKTLRAQAADGPVEHLRIFFIGDN